MAIVQLAAAFLIACLPKLSAVSVQPGSAPPLVNCTEYKNCAPPFNHCDVLTGACQVLSRSGNFWELSEYQTTIPLFPLKDKHTAVVCSEDGNYPSHDCRYFYECANGTSVMKSCNSPGFPYFDPVSERCTSTATCPTFHCFERFNSRVGLEGLLSTFFAYCVRPSNYRYLESSQSSYILNAALKNLFIPYIVTRCYGKDILNENTGRCEPHCLQEGLIPDTTDCHHYFLCSLEDPIDSKFTMARLSCPQRQAFLPTEHRCVPEERVSSCTSPRAWPL